MATADGEAARRGIEVALPTPRRVVLLAVVVVLAVSGVAAALAVRAYDDQRALTLDRQAQEAANAAGAVDDAIGRRRQVLRVVAAAPAAADEDVERLDRYFARLGPGELGFTGGISWIDRHGDLRATWQADGGVARIWLGDRAYVRDALATGEEQPLAIVPGRLRPTTLLVLAVPTRRSDGDVNGVVAGSVRLDRPNDLGPGRGAVLVDAAGRLLSTGSGTLPTPAAVADPRGLPSMLAQRRGLVEGASPLGLPGDRLVAFAATREPGLLVLVDRGRDAALAGARRDLAIELGLLAAAALVALASIVWSVRRTSTAQHRALSRAIGLQEATAALAGAATRAEVVEAVLDRLPPIADARGALAALPAADGAGLEVVGARGALARLRGVPPPAADAPEAERWLAVARRAAGGPVELLPLGDGALALAWRAGDPREEDRRVVESLAVQAAQAFDRARLFDEERDIARTLQLALLPPLRPLPGVTTAARYRPAVATLDVGGDWYDAFAMPDGRVALVIGDAAGRGLSAATLMGQVRNAVRSLVAGGHRGGQLLEHVDAFAAETGLEAVATLAVLHVDPSSGLVTFASAGHPPPIVLDDDGATTIGGALGPPVGAALGHREERTLVLPRASRLVLYTDGLVERRHRPIDVGLERLCVAVEEAAARPLEAFADAVLDRVLDDAPGDDDVALLCCALAPDPLVLVRAVPPAPASVGVVRHALAAWLDERGVTDGTATDVVLATGEVVANAVEHGGRSARGEPVIVVARLESGSVEVRVEDAGAWRAPPASGEPGERGRGLAIARALMDEVELDRRGRGTVVRLRRQLGGARAAEAALAVAGAGDEHAG